MSAFVVIIKTQFRTVHLIQSAMGDMEFTPFDFTGNTFIVNNILCFKFII